MTESASSGSYVATETGDDGQVLAGAGKSPHDLWGTGTLSHALDAFVRTALCNAPDVPLTWGDPVIKELFECAVPYLDASNTHAYVHSFEVRRTSSGTGYVWQVWDGDVLVDTWAPWNEAIPDGWPLCVMTRRLNEGSVAVARAVEVVDEDAPSPLQDEDDAEVNAEHVISALDAAGYVVVPRAISAKNGAVVWMEHEGWVWMDNAHPDEWMRMSDCTFTDPRLTSQSAGSVASVATED